MFWEMFQQSQIHKAMGKASRAEMKVGQTEEYFRLIEDKIGRLALACQSLWEIVEEQTDVTHAQLLAKMEEVDMRDGVKDGKISSTPLECQSCGRKTNRRRPICLYCGAKNNSKEVFGIH